MGQVELQGFGFVTRLAALGASEARAGGRDPEQLPAAISAAQAAIEAAFGEA